MNRLAVGLAVGAGYVLGRTKKAKFAFAVGSMVAGKRLNLSPKALGQMVTQQLENNPQFKEIGDQLRQDMRGVGKAATGSLLNRQLEGLADRLHDRTLGVQDRISGVVPDEVKGGGKRDRDADDDGYDDEEPASERDSDADAKSDADAGADSDADSDSERSGQRKKAPAKRSAPKAGAKTASKTAAKKAPAKKTAQNTARKTAQKKTAAASRGTARRATSSARSGGGRTKGGSDHG
ncbi:DNA primase [Streptomyces venezuelae]|uniref:DNA primase n=1 Tax=Streptomyces venezuelae TaxID=54571 RepID=UPI003664DF78